METSLDHRIADMDEQVALPCQNGELVFAAPWEARAFGLAVALNERGMYEWRDFSQGLAMETASADRYGLLSSYYERWLATLEKLAIAKGLVTPEEIEARATEYASGAHDDHGYHDDHRIITTYTEPDAKCGMRQVAKPMRHCVGAAQLPTADAVAEGAECGMKM